MSAYETFLKEVNEAGFRKGSRVAYEQRLESASAAYSTAEDAARKARELFVELQNRLEPLRTAADGLKALDPEIVTGIIVDGAALPGLAAKSAELRAQRELLDAAVLRLGTCLLPQAASAHRKAVQHARAALVESLACQLRLRIYDHLKPKSKKSTDAELQGLAQVIVFTQLAADEAREDYERAEQVCATVYNTLTRAGIITA